MNSLRTWKHSLLATAMLLGTAVVGQTSYKESFDVNKDAVVEVNTSHTNVIFETWDKNKVEVYAYIDDDKLSNKEKKELFDKWELDVLGNSKKVVITSNLHGWDGWNSEAYKSAMSAISKMPSMEGLDEMPSIEGMPDMDFDIDVPELPDFKDFPQWPFGDDKPTVVSSDGKISYNDHIDIEFDEDEYEKNKQAYVDKLNRKHGSNATVAQTDKWLAEVDKWAEEFSAVMEEWGEDFGKEFEEKFGPEFEQKMEAWGEEFGQSMEAWGEAFGEKFAEEMEAWGEEFGKDMEEWAKRFEEEAAHWEENFEYEHENGSKKVHVKGKSGSAKANKTIIIKMPKGTKTDVNVRHGELKMADAYNIKAKLDYATFTANSIDGGSTLIDASYAPVHVNQWKNGELHLNYVTDCRINQVDKLSVYANSSDVTVLSVDGQGFFSGSIGHLYIKNVSDNFTTMDVVLENSDATINLPKKAFNFYYNGRRSRCELPKELVISAENKNSNNTVYRAYNKAPNSNSAISISAAYSKLKLQ